MIKNALLILGLATGLSHAQRVITPVPANPFVRSPLTNLPNQGVSMRLPVITAPIALPQAPIISVPVAPHRTLPTIQMSRQSQAVAVAELPEARELLPLARERLGSRNGRALNVEALNKAFDNKGPKPTPIQDDSELPETPEAPLTLPEWELEQEIGIP